MNKKQHPAFTLIELLVVVTIIVVLLALLVPAMDKAIYAAELTVCGANLKAIATSVNAYAFDYKRHYPDRPGIRNDGEMPIYAWRPNTISDSISHDDRLLLATFLSLNKHLSCPLNVDVDFEGSRSTTVVEADYNLWFGFRYPGTAGMMKVGDKITWAGNRFGILADDYDMLNVQANDDHATHPDADGVLVSIKAQDEGAIQFTLSRWASNSVTYKRGPMERNFAYDDGSVRRLEKLVIDPDTGEQDDRLAVLPPFAESSDTVNHKNSLPLR